MSIDVEITKLDGSSFLLSGYDAKALDFIVSSPELESNYGSVEGRNGSVDYGAVFGQRTIAVPFLLTAPSNIDVAYSRDALFSLVVQKDPFYIEEIRDGSGTERRYLVRIQNSYELNQRVTTGSAELQFETVESPLAESPWTTLNGLPTGFDVQGSQYAITGSTFRIYNDGDETVHPFEHDFVLTIDDVVSSSTSLELENTTNGSIFTVNEGVANTSTIVIDGPTVTSNGLQYLRKTNRTFIELSPGWNDFVLRGATEATVYFDFRFYYK